MSNGWRTLRNLFWQMDAEGPDPGELLTVLEPLRDVGGVVGSLVVDSTGSVCGSDLPRLFDEQLVNEVGARMLELWESLGDAREPSAGTLEFAGHSFHVKTLGCGMIGVLMERTANPSALSMALNLVGRRVASILAASSES